MTDILKGALSGAWTWLISFVLPATLLLGALGLLVKLQDPDPHFVGAWMSWKGDSRLLMAGFAALTLGMVLFGLNNGILRVLEGYIGIRQVESLWDRMCARQRKKRRQLQDELQALNAKGADDASSLSTAFLIEQLMHYPAADNQVGPTRFGNAVRSFETYGATTFGLDSQTLWQEIIASCPESARAEQASARAYVDFLANLLFTSLLFTITAGVGFALHPSVTWAVAFVIGVLLHPLWYQLAVHAAFQWAGTVRAVVNLGRLQLAGSLGFELPRRREDEVVMWHNLVWLVREGPVAGEDPLYRFRSRPKAP